MKILICDDSVLARKSLSRSLTEVSSDDLFFAEHGREALEIIDREPIDVMFLDLTMPIMNGFEVLEHLHNQNSPIKTVVISGDVQRKSIERCLKLGAFSFIKKPFDRAALAGVVSKLGITLDVGQKKVDDVSYTSKLKELANIALGRGAALVAEHISSFVNMPIPNAGTLSTGALEMTINDVLDRENSVAIAQRFVGDGIHGEALVCLRGRDLKKAGAQLHFNFSSNELFHFISHLLVSSFLSSLSEQLATQFSLRQPVFIEQLHRDINFNDTKGESDVFTIEYSYSAGGSDFEADVLLFMDSASVNKLKQLMEML